MSYFDYPSGHMIGTLSLLGLYDYDGTIFDDFILPDGIDRDNILTMICFETADCEVLYPNPILLKKLIKAWSEMRLPTWQKVYDAISAEYGVLDERSYTEKINTTGTSTSKAKSKGGAVATGTTDTEAKGRGFNSDEMIATNQGASNSTNSSLSNSESDSDITSAGITLREGTGRNKSGAELVKAAADAAMLNLYDMIVGEFKERFIILVY